ncbi:HAD domain-containing protein [Cryobacterium sp. Y11]|uniref:HAD domain-containing protein n=1 Tax=Cryobacterium sp. Y11 TaxID=2045016 RepID=UPI000CE43E71|nr:HAD domain-containing protein [Cryobacterium sp. Y11]
MTTRTVLILLDVDGVLNPRVVNQRLMLDAPRALLVRQLAALGSIVWATTWSPTHTFHLTKDLGLSSHTAGIAFPRNLHADPSAPAPTAKLHWVARWLARQDPQPDAVIWVDDILRQDAVDWATAQTWPTLLVQPDMNRGLTDAQVDDVRRFIESLEPTDTPTNQRNEP